MQANRNIASVLSLCLVLLPACSAMQAREAMSQRAREMKLSNEAWEMARLRLVTMCPDPPKTVAEYQAGILLRKQGKDPFSGCDVRLVKQTNGPALDDWRWYWLPSYQIIITVHEEELRKRVTPKVYEEYILGLSHYLARKTESGEITPQQLMYAFNEGWKWLYGKMQEEQILL